MPKKPRQTPRISAKERRRQRFEPANTSSAPTFEDSYTRPRQQRAAPKIIALTEAQADYDDAIHASRITFGIGPAGTGKTYFAAMRAAEALDKGEIEKIYLTRPAVEAGESLGFLPGDLDEKYEPYLRPFRDALVEYFGVGHLEYLIRKKIIEPVPLGFLRGSTIKNAWLLADEMQNASREQLKMLMTRMGKESKFVINGDPRQSDIGSASGLSDAAARVCEVEGVSIIRFKRSDVVRDDIVAEILGCYEEDD